MRPSGGARRRRSSLQGLRDRLGEAEATLAAIGRGEVDAVVVSGPDGDRALTIEGATHPYHVLLNAMTDGAALLAFDGTILFSNRRLREIANSPLEVSYGSKLQQLVAAAERPSCEESLRAGAERGCAREFSLAGGGARATPVLIALSAVPVGSYPDVPGPRPRHSTPILMAIITDLTDRKRAEAMRLRLMERVISAEDDERRRIARELHDETGQSLTALLVGLRTIEDLAAIAEVRSIAVRLRGVTAQTLDNLGRLARGLHPSVFDDMGLAAAATRYVRDYAESFGIASSFRSDGLDSRRLNPLAETTMYRILQEALTNVARHAQAQRVSVELKHEGSSLELVVQDDGVGFDVGRALDRTSGLGLHGMQERVTLLGGSVQIASKPGRGTELRARIPGNASGATTPRPARGRRPRRPSA